MVHRALAAALAAAALVACGARTALPDGEAVSRTPSFGADGGAGADTGTPDAAGVVPDGSVPHSACGPRTPVCPNDACHEGSCAPVVLATGPDGMAGLAVDDVNVYFTDSGDQTLRSVPKCGGDVVLLAATETFPGPIVADGARVYWESQSAAGSIASIPRGGGASTTLASWAMNQPDGLVTDGSRLYFALELGSPPPGVVAVPMGGGAVKSISTTFVANLAIDATSLYGTVYGTAPKAAIVSIPKGGGSATTIASLDDPSTIVGGVAVDATHVYWTTRTGAQSGGLSRVLKSGGATASLALVGSTPGAVVVDESCVYWGEEGSAPGNGRIARVPTSGGASETLATTQDRPFTIVVDAASVYWVNFGGQVMRAPK